MSTDSLGKRLKTLRLRKELTGSELARRAGVSPSLISRVERGKAQPSLNVLRRMADALEAPLSDLVDERPQPVVMEPHRAHVAKRPIDQMVVRKNERLKVIHPISKTVYELLTPNLNGRHEVLLMFLAPGQEHVSRAGAHLEGEETNFVLKGVCQAWIDGAEVTLMEGDAITYDATLSHRYRNIGTENTVLLAVVTPPHVGL